MTYTTKTATALALILAGGSASAEELSMLIGNDSDMVAIAEALSAAYTEQNPDVTFDIEIRPGGSEGDNLVMTRLVTGEMADIFENNSGALLQALRPSRTLVPLNDIEAMDRLPETYTETVSDDEGSIYGVPWKPFSAGGIFYHRPTYEELGLEVPTTWDEFMANNAAIAEQTDKAPIIQTYGDTWTSQIIVLADYYNVQSEAPDFAEEFTANETKFATTPAALRSFERLQQVHESGYVNEDYAAASYNEGLRMVGSGEGVHYPMLTVGFNALKQNNPELLENVGIFGMPNDDPEDNGLTVWVPDSYYIPKSSENQELAKDFLNFVASTDGCEVILDTIGAVGPFVVEGCTLPDDVLPGIAELLPYFEEEGRTAPALEFVSPLKGPSLEQLTVEVGSGIREAQSAAELYDQDVAKQARQLGLENW
ncbi:ABC transporter substrate-binding protein [Allosediminivita pacifica]|uniref:Carbohydrate ABC transporter substrate-binding protein (CUT1 family) n=1 Tax=Allosediminivita pacifica TaxID=1267769 RepID=A0A2T6ATH7_9RHOB|nr:extracellular solute-binding protein [Allosediminivita pacifica]PTX47120.1 carbohydrate ABC transporter substrate-binding protein (CUT1 family) [Allosediminivita pacifica]GGB10095.1 sugar ABC transporter substrate-binding protein [Allosediminivita pacifica]